MRSAILYARVDMVTSEPSLERQLQACRTFSENWGFTAIQEITEIGHGNAGWTDRPQLALVRDLLHSGQVDALVIIGTDIISTLPQYWENFSDEFSERGAVIHIVGPAGDLIFSSVKFNMEQQP